MCGIAGLFDSSRSPDPPQAQAVVADLCRRQRHRGPDAGGLWTSPDGACVLGHRRLAIIDLDPRANQPMQDAAGRWVLVFNGEIYNYLELRRELEALGASFRTASDTEVLLQAYAQWGPESFARLDGMFAFALYDRDRRELLLVRDRAGEKPLYVARAGSRIAFASEFKPLLAVPGLPLELCEAALAEYLSLRYVPAPHTLYESITSVQPGTWQLFRADGSWTERSYFAFDLAGPGIAVDEDDYVDSLQSELVRAVRTRMMADVPVGAFLSSGVDSSLVCAVAARELASDIRCFGAGFADGGEDNETLAARQIAGELGLPFEEYIVSEEDLLGAASTFGAQLDEPNGDRSCVPTYFLSGLVRRHVTVAISGDGGDELFGGYGRYLAHYGAGVAVGDELRGVQAYFQQGLPMFPWQSLQQAFPRFQAGFDRRVAARFLSAFARKELDTVERLRLVDFHSYLPGAVLPKVDRMAMRHSLEVRTPFFSPGLLALSAVLPRSLCTQGRLQKLALRRLLGEYLPPHLVKPAKQGFGMPVSFMQRQAPAFGRLADRADEALAAWAPLAARPAAFEVLQRAARQNINSYWAWIALGQWVASAQSVAAS